MDQGTKPNPKVQEFRTPLGTNRLANVLSVLRVEGMSNTTTPLQCSEQEQQ